MTSTTEHTEHTENTEAEPTLLQQMGGVTGLVASTLPILVLVPVNNYFGLGWALGAALGVAFLIFLWRALRRESLQPAVNALVGVVFGAVIAWLVGDAKGYFLYGIWASLVLAVVAIASVIFRWPAVGVIWKGLNGEDMVWRAVPKARRAYAWATLGWAVVFISRFLVQNTFYNSDATNALAVARLLMGWPLTGVVLVLTIWMVRRANTAVEDAEAADLVPTTRVIDDTDTDTDGDDTDNDNDNTEEARAKDTPHERHHP